MKPLFTGDVTHSNPKTKRRSGESNGAEWSNKMPFYFINSVKISFCVIYVIFNTTKGEGSNDLSMGYHEPFSVGYNLHGISISGTSLKTYRFWKCSKPVVLTTGKLDGELDHWIFSVSNP